MDNKWKAICTFGDLVIIAVSVYLFIRGKATYEDHIYIWGSLVLGLLGFVSIYLNNKK